MLPQPEDTIFNYQKILQNPIWSQRHFNTSSADALLLCSPKTPPVILAAAAFFLGGERNHLMGLFLLAFESTPIGVQNSRRFRNRQGQNDLIFRVSAVSNKNSDSLNHRHLHTAEI